MKNNIIIYTLITILLLITCNKSPNTKIEMSNLSDETIKTFSSKTLFFGHQSVGKSLVNSISGRYFSKFSIIETRDSADIFVPSFVHERVGQNTNPKSKIDDFKHIIMNGVGDKVDVAMLKLCYVDISSETDVHELITHYSNAINEIKDKYPNLKIVHFTVPLKTKPSGIKGLIKTLMGKKDINRIRNEYNELLRRTYPPTEIFDIAGFESTHIDGRINKYKGNQVALCNEYSSDGGHLNELGAKYISDKLIEFIALIE